MEFAKQLNSNFSSKFGSIEPNKYSTVNIICAILLALLIIILIVCLVTKRDKFSNKNPRQKIKLIGSMRCPYCQKAVQLLKELDIDYEFIESNTAEGRKYMTEKKANGVPLLIHNKGIIIGFDKDEIEKLANK